MSSSTTRLRRRTSKTDGCSQRCVLELEQEAAQLRLEVHNSQTELTRQRRLRTQERDLNQRAGHGPLLDQPHPPLKPRGAVEVGVDERSSPRAGVTEGCGSPSTKLHKTSVCRTP